MSFRTVQRSKEQNRTVTAAKVEHVFAPFGKPPDPRVETRIARIGRTRRAAACFRGVDFIPLIDAAPIGFKQRNTLTDLLGFKQRNTLTDLYCIYKI